MRDLGHGPFVLVAVLCSVLQEHLLCRVFYAGLVPPRTTMKSMLSVDYVFW